MSEFSIPQGSGAICRARSCFSSVWRPLPDARIGSLACEMSDDPGPGHGPAGLIVGLLVLVALVAVIVEGFVRPAQAVIRSGDDQITLEEWQNRVRFQRAQFITAMEDQLEMFGGDIGLIQQFNQQQISLLLQPELLGELVLEQMANEILIEQEAAARGIEVSSFLRDGRISTY